jgi:lipopolysaccharide/colanic/teichoic acid biosynthesis glycosyltransferase
MKKELSVRDKNNIASLSLWEETNLIKTVRDSDKILPDFSGDNYLSQFLHFQKTPSESFLTQPLDFGINRVIKRWMDIIIAAIFITCILSWLTPILAILIKIDSKGPEFFLQKRNKKNGRIFTCIKIRYMIVNAQADLVQAMEGDIRITHFGKFLRKNHLDELPQFINVLLGDMSVIGPRPHMISDNLKYQPLISHYSLRSNIKPGITGLAQVSGYTGPVTDIVKMKLRVQMDNFYISHWSLKMDTMILYKTMFKAISLNVFSNRIRKQIFLF